MIQTKFCDVCNRGFPPAVFAGSYDCLDTKLHENHPWKDSTRIRITVSPRMTNGSDSYWPDVCPECRLKMVQDLAAKLARRNKREMPRLLAMLTPSVQLRSHQEHGPK